VLTLGYEGELLNVLLIVTLLDGTKLLHEPLGLVLVLVVDELQVHVDEHRVEDQC